MNGGYRASWLMALCDRPAAQRAVRRLAPIAGRPWFPVLGAIVAFAATLSMAIPTVPLLCALVLLDRRRWLSIALWAMFGSAAAGALLVHVLGHFGAVFIARKLPELAASAHWQHLVAWVTTHGWWTLALVAASPISQTPVLILAAMLGMSAPTVFFSLFGGKAVKYGVIARLTAKSAQSLGAGPMNATP